MVTIPNKVGLTIFPEVREKKVAKAKPVSKAGNIMVMAGGLVAVAGIGWIAYNFIKKQGWV